MILLFQKVFWPLGILIKPKEFLKKIYSKEPIRLSIFLFLIANLLNTLLSDGYFEISNFTDVIFNIGWWLLFSLVVHSLIGDNNNSQNFTSYKKMLATLFSAMIAPLILFAFWFNFVPVMQSPWFILISILITIWFFYLLIITVMVSYYDISIGRSIGVVIFSMFGSSIIFGFIGIFI